MTRDRPPCTIIPGIIYLHAHYNFDLVDNGRAEEVVYNGIIFLANGVTSTWSAGEFFPERVLEQRDRVDAGEAARLIRRHESGEIPAVLE